MDIGATGGVGGTHPLQGPHRMHKLAAAAYSTGAGKADQVDLSGPGTLISKALGLPSIRMDRVNEVKALIDSGRFETDARLEGALQKFAIENPDVLG
jgi:hypothetical protein